MRFLVNMNLPPSLAKRLTDAGHQSRHVREAGLANADDSAIVESAGKTGETIITHDLDYGNILAFSGASAPSIIIFRTSSVTVDSLYSRISRELREIEEPLQRGAIVVIDDAAIRIRSLPISD